MQDVVKINLNGVVIYLMEVSDLHHVEYCQSLLPTEKNRHEKILHPAKKIEFAATRHLKHQLFGNAVIEYTNSGTPFLENEGNIAISHTKKLVGIAVSTDHAIGFDIEPITPKAKQVASKFCNDAESLFFDTENEKDMTLLWSFKETLYKLSDRKKLIFKTDLLVSKEDENLIGHVRATNGFFKTQLDFTEFNQNYITCNHTSLELLHEYSL